MDIRSLNKVLTMSEEEIKTSSLTKLEEKQLEKRIQRQERINEVRRLYKEGYSKRKIAEMTGIARQTIIKYTDDSYRSEHASLGIKRKSKLDPYIEMIEELFDKGIPSSKITEKITQIGYSGSESNLRHYVSKLKKKNKKDEVKKPDKAMEIISRSEIIKLLYHPIEKHKTLKSEQFQAICDKHPKLLEIYNLVWEFKAIFKSHNVPELSKWMVKAKELDIRELNSFVNGLERDLTAVKNAMIYEINNGLAEGFVNKIKVIKRIMFGRCGFETLRRKVLFIEEMKDFN